MADRFPGHITLGGKVVIKTVEQREAVENALSHFSSDTSHNWGESPWDEPISIENCNKYLNDENCLHGKNDEARYGEFEDLEIACRDAGIGYDRHSSARYEYDAELVRWRPGMDEPFQSVAVESGNQTIEVLTVQSLIDGAGSLGQFMIAFQKATGGNIKDLEPLEIIDEAPNEPEDDGFILNS